MGVNPDQCRGRLFQRYTACLKAKGPKSFIEGFRPVFELMHHHGASPGRDGLDGALGCAVLEVSANATEVEVLTEQGNIVLKSSGVERLVIDSVLLDRNSM